jgi:hypothetical protein
MDEHLETKVEHLGGKLTDTGYSFVHNCRELIFEFVQGLAEKQKAEIIWEKGLDVEWGEREEWSKEAMMAYLEKHFRPAGCVEMSDGMVGYEFKVIEPSKDN